MGFAASFVARLLHRYRWIAYIGLLVIFYVAVKMLLDGAVDQCPEQFGFLGGWFGGSTRRHCAVLKPRRASADRLAWGAWGAI